MRSTSLPAFLLVLVLPAAAHAQAPRGNRVVAAGETLELPAGPSFGATDTALDEKSAARLAPLAAYLKANPGLKIRVECHVDPSGNAVKNVTLTQARADSVVAALVGRGVDPAQLEAVGMGGTEPLAPSSTAEGKAANARVVFRVLERDGVQVPRTVAQLLVDGIPMDVPGEGERVSRMGDRVARGTTLRVPEGTDAPLAMRAHGNLLFNGGSRAVLAPGVVELQQGGFSAQVLGGSPVPLKVRTAALEAQVTDAAVEISTTETGALEVVVLSGKPVKVFTAPADPKARPRATVAPGTRVAVDATGKAQKAEKLPRGPESVPVENALRALALGERGTLPGVAWKPVTGAAGYVLMAQPTRGGAPARVRVDANTTAAALSLVPGTYQLQLAVVDDKGRAGMPAPGPWAFVVQSPVEGLAPAASEGAAPRISLGRVHAWPEGVLCNGEERTRFGRVGRVEVTCTDPDGEVFSPVALEVVPVDARLGEGAKVEQGMRVPVELTVTGVAPLPRGLSVGVSGPLKLGRVTPGATEEDGRVRKFTVEVEGFTPGEGAVTVTSDMTGTLLAEVMIPVVEPPPPPPPPPAPVAAAEPPKPVAPPPPEKPYDPFERFGALRSWIPPATVAAVVGVGAFLLTPLALLGMGAWAWAANTQAGRDSGANSTALLSVGGLLATVAATGWLVTSVLAVVAVSQWGLDHAL